jgi:hypothetical protein
MICRSCIALIPLPQSLLPVSEKRRQQIADDPARAGPDLDRHGHAGPRDGLTLDLHLRAVERHARRVDELLALRLAGRFVRPRRRNAKGLPVYGFRYQAYVPERVRQLTDGDRARR